MGKIAIAIAMACACGRLGYDAQSIADAGGDAPSLAACGGHVVFQDSFASAAIDASRWQIITTAGLTVTEMNGLVIQFATTVASQHSAGVAQLAAHDMRGESIAFELVTTPNPATIAYTSGAMVTPANDEVAFEVQGGILYAIYYHQATANTVVVGQITYDAATQRFQRIRETAGTYDFAFSADGQTYTQFATATQTAIDVSSAVIRLEAATPGVTVMNGGTATFAAISECGP